MKNSTYYIRMKKLISFIKVVAEIIIKFILNSISRNEEIGICISTVKGYSDVTIPNLILQLRNNGVRLSNIYVFEGGYYETKKIDKGYTHFQVNHNSFDYTSLISILELKIIKKNWLLLHDTIELTWPFRFIYKSLNSKEYDCMPLRNYPSMNIGVYSHVFLKKNFHFIMSQKNIDFTESGLQNAKKNSIVNEDYLFKVALHKKYIYPFFKQYESSKDACFNGNKRKKEYYPQLGIIKFKANYTTKKESFSVTL